MIILLYMENNHQITFHAIVFVIDVCDISLLFYAFDIKSKRLFINMTGDVIKISNIK